jgi:hypothetical protein
MARQRFGRWIPVISQTTIEIEADSFDPDYPIIEDEPSVMSKLEEQAAKGTANPRQREFVSAIGELAIADGSVEVDSALDRLIDAAAALNAENNNGESSER